jgi:hypothetical protein
MTEVATEVLAELVPPVPPPELAAEVEAPAPDGAAPADERLRAACATSEPPVPERVLAEIDPAVGALRRAIIDHLADSVDAGPQSVAMILSAMPAGTSRNTLESALRRSFTAGEIERTGPGQYIIGKPKPAQPAPSPEPEPVRAVDEMTDQAWLEACEGWLADASSWPEELGPGPDNVDNRIPPPIRTKFVDRLRKREERRKDRDAALARQAEADAALRAKLVQGCFNNVTLGPAINDLSVIKAMLQVIPLEHVLLGLKRVVDRRIEPKAAPIARWTDERFLVSVARTFLLNAMLPQMVETWKAAGTAPQKAADALKASPAAQVPAAPETAPAAPRGNGSE